MVFQFQENRVRRAYIGGSRKLCCPGSQPLFLTKGSSFFITANSGNLCLEGQAEIILCTP